MVEGAVADCVVGILIAAPDSAGPLQNRMEPLASPVASVLPSGLKSAR
jgi:hypothetical protein